MTVITPQVVAVHANALLTLIDNADQFPLEVSGLSGTVSMDGLTATIHLVDGDGPYELILRPRGIEEPQNVCEECGAPIPGELITNLHAESCSGHPRNVV